MSHFIRQSRREFLGVAAIGAASTLGAFSPFSSPFIRRVERVLDLSGAVGWLNSPPLSSESLRGKVVLADIWTYSCINSLRQLPYLKSWAAKYKDAGLVVIGVHSPEFTFERDRANVERAVRDAQIRYPVAIDSDRRIWNALNNEYWPADYFLDARENIRRYRFGEGDYAASEQMIQSLLKENGARVLSGDVVGPTGEGIEAPPSAQVQTPETYVGYRRSERFGSPERIARDTARVYSLPSSLPFNGWALSGSWNVGAETAVVDTASAKIAFRFHARDLHLVLGPSKSGQHARFRVRLDSSAPGTDHGTDSATDGSGEIREPRLYQLIRQKGNVETRTFEIEFLDPGAQAFSFTFG